MTTSTSGLVRYLCTAMIAGSAFLATGCNSPDGPLPDNARKQGIALYNKGEYTDAAGSFQNAVRQDPRDYRSHYYLGASYDALKSYQQAIQSFRSALDYIDITSEGRLDKPFRMRIINGLAGSIAKSENREGELARLTGGGQPTAQNLTIVAKVHTLTGDADAALEAYRGATGMEPRNFLLMKDYGLYLEKLGQSQQAEDALRRAYTLHSGDKEVNDALRRLGVVPGPTIRKS